ncbi:MULTISPECIES: sugar ABC transporter ATP-binding protein [unclassified Ensifer]|uniref:sugar ABC transporter ATP-binding protein n=1 Tax=unclassified Ensifer TaxID=2633371 RepID=UPI00071563B9|nr:MULTISPECIES: sugar ABC transporter ATP-binding protein [unclassified Ensifer]KQX51317.1 ribose ABC transporter ATP-binding protein [Ensifer sp. Root1298]KQX83682.1 ribose ABC transporter ATP-binding protein [Ensifer sp. Root1312]KRC20027.1 ribose ABC transporter ATP-binding protein [Ensifer sp. Root74]KRD63274.1 ribose ABC transporter ATP-binding protein [Ensifer sp. Root954]
MTQNPLLEMKGISKRFGNMLALNGINLVLNPGDVLGLVGENGAGKSTLMKILAGAYGRDEGTISVRGDVVELDSPRAGADAGIAIIYQELSLFPDFDAGENVFAGRELTRGRFGLAPLDHARMREEARRILTEDLGVDVPVDRPVRELSLSHRQMIEIAKALSTNADIIIMDEPTEALEEAERKQLFAAIERLQSAGKAIIYVSHRIQELLGICTRVMVLRDGNTVADHPTAGLDVDKVVGAMIGGSLAKQFPPRVPAKSEPSLEVRGLTKRGAFEDISFTLAKGEIFGIAGLEGSGKSALLRSLFGQRPCDAGQISIDGRSVEIKGPVDAIRERMAFLPAERKTEGIFPQRSVAWNLSIANLRAIGRTTLNPAKEREVTSGYISKLGVKCDGPDAEITSLSGGNQQKVLLARWLLTGPKILLLEEPTRGVDVRAKSEVYALVHAAAKEGCSVIVVSADNAELLGLCHRVAVMFEGKITTVVDAATSKEETLALHTVRSPEALHHHGGNNV